MPSLRTTNAWPIAVEGAPAPRGVAVADMARATATEAFAPAKTSEATAALPPSSPHAPALQERVTQSLIAPLTGSHLDTTAGLNGPLTAPVDAESHAWPPDPFQTAQTPAGSEIWQAAMRADPNAIAAPRPTLVFGYAPAGEQAARDAQPASLPAGLPRPMFAPARPGAGDDAVGPVAAAQASPAPRATFVPKANDPERRARKALGDGADGAAWPQNDGPAPLLDVGALDRGASAAADADSSKQQVFDQAALAASFAPMSAQILQQRAAEERRWRERLRRRHSARRPERVAAGNKAPPRALARGTDETEDPWRR